MKFIIKQIGEVLKSISLMMVSIRNYESIDNFEQTEVNRFKPNFQNKFSKVFERNFVSFKDNKKVCFQYYANSSRTFFNS